MRKSIQAVQAECERLRARMVDAERECERLRAESNNASAACREHSEMMASERREALDECERLRVERDVDRRVTRNLSEEVERQQRALTAAYATSELFAAECLRWRRAHADSPAMEGHTMTNRKTSEGER